MGFGAKEIGGYIEFEYCDRPMLHESSVKLNCGRNALAYLLEARKIRKIALPKFMCDSCDGVIRHYGVSVRYYAIGLDFKPVDLRLMDDEWLYLVNFYGQLSNSYIQSVKEMHEKLIVDHAQAYFQMPLDHVDTLYTCRKFFGVADGAILYTDAKIDRELVRDESFERMHFLLGRFERTASEFYSEYVANNDTFDDEPMKVISKLTENLLRFVDYERVKEIRTRNFAYLQERLGDINRLNLMVPEGAFMYPLYIENGSVLRKALQIRKLYIPTLWPAVFDRCTEKDVEYDLAMNVLPLPCDQRYGVDDMKDMCDLIEHIILHQGKNDE